MTDHLVQGCQSYNSSGLSLNWPKLFLTARLNILKLIESIHCVTKWTLLDGLPTQHTVCVQKTDTTEGGFEIGHLSKWPSSGIIFNNVAPVKKM